jgi:hypothetical protein
VLEPNQVKGENKIAKRIRVDLFHRELLRKECQSRKDSITVEWL